MARMDMSRAFVKLQYEKGQLIIPELTAYSAGGEYHMNGSLPLDISLAEGRLGFDRMRPLDLSISGQDTTLPYLTAFIPVIEELSGRFDTELHIGGSLSDPVRNGQITVS